MKGRQLALAVQLRDAATFESYYPGPNADVMAALQGPHSLLIYGPAGSGKTHLLHALARGGAAYLPLREFAAHGPETLEGFSAQACLLLDDLGAVSADIEWSLALLRLLDERHAHPLRTVIAGHAPPEALRCALPDLKTRLNRLALFGLRPLDETQRMELLRDRGRSRGLQLPDEVMHWMLTHLPRDAGSLLGALETLDRAALTAKRRLTLPLALSVLGAPAPAGARTD